MKVIIYKKFERFWHWSQALLMMAMLITGFEIHGTYTLVGFGTAVLWHEYCAFTLMTLWVFAIFWHFTTGEWRQYIPTTYKLSAVINYYSKGIFKGETHPFHPTAELKLNPLQRFTYLGWKLVMAPTVWITGLLLLFYSEWESLGLGFLSLGWIATLHVISAFMILTFLIGHVYMTTTGETPTAHIKPCYVVMKSVSETIKLNNQINTPRM
ncbi:cytochrome b/b6 domain-containing protein [Vibrio cincinnatiensis]|uniref:cytochrome b/b6 domain-containing protein n=1 Tax=Vibrio cincinnatiensis TaxID=675 RepID=UPI0019310713|nr:cytochrome b/b6 domain-containing protein [Vibrio cincinnatiensis]